MKNIEWVSAAYHPAVLYEYSRCSDTVMIKLKDGTCKKGYYVHDLDPVIRGWYTDNSHRIPDGEVVAWKDLLE